MFPKNKINIIFRILCLISYSTVILVVNSTKTLIILGIVYCFFAFCEKNFRNIELIIASIIFLWLSYTLNNFIFFKIMLLIDYCIYFLESGYYVEEKTITASSEQDYIRFKSVKKKKKKGTSNIVAVYLTAHLVVLFLAIMVG